MEEYKNLRLNNEELRALGVAIANQIICNNQRIKTNEFDNVKIEEKNDLYRKILTIIKYLER